MKSSIFLLSLLALFLFFKRADIADTGQSLFFPKDMYTKVESFSHFQLGTWSNIIVRNESDALKLCEELRQNKNVEKVICEPNLNDFLPLAKRWLEDQFYIYQAPAKIEFEKLSNNELTKISMLMGPMGQSILELIRRDPVNHKEDLLEKVKTKMSSNFVWKEGLLRHKDSPAILIPIQFNYKPEEIAKTAEVEKVLSRYGAVMLGMHQGQLSNQGTIIQDLDNVGMVGTIVSILSLCFIVYFKMFRLVKLVIPNAIGICVSIIATWLVFGKVHAITISFGTGIIGLSMDYGLHAFFLEDKKRVWNSNLFGFLTTLAVFIIFIFSAIPLIQQMMFFSTVALLFSYLFTYFLIREDHISVARAIVIKKSKWHLVSLILALAGFYYMSHFSIDTSVKRFNYTTKEVEKAQTWFYSQMKDEKIYFKVYPITNWKELEKDFQLTDKAGIHTESIYSFLPSVEKQKENVKTWIKFRDDHFKTTSDKEKIFRPFLEKLSSLKEGDSVRLESHPQYLEHLVQNDKMVNLWFTKNAEEEKILLNIKGADSLVDIFINFTKRMTDEIYRFMPITGLLIFALLFYKYFNVKKSLICLIPFLYALGLYGILYKFFHFPMSFMTLLGLFLIYGLSVDYGIFSTDLFTRTNRTDKTESSFNTGIMMAWGTTFLGFAPLLFCHHPILKDLGTVLVVGMIGVFYGTFFVIPALFLKLDEGRKE